MVGLIATVNLVCCVAVEGVRILTLAYEVYAELFVVICW